MGWVRYGDYSVYVPRKQQRAYEVRDPSADRRARPRRTEVRSSHTFRRVMQEASSFWPHIAGLLLLNLMSIPLALLTPIPLKVAVDSVLKGHRVPEFLDWFLPRAHGPKMPLLLMTALLVILIALMVYLHGLALWVAQTYTGEKVTLRFRRKLFEHAQRLSLSYHDVKGAADSTYRIQYDAPSIRYVAVDGIVPVVGAVLTLLAMLYVTARIDWQLAAVALGICPVLFWLGKKTSGPLRERWKQVKGAESSAMSVVQEALAAMRVVKAFGQEEREKERFARRSKKSVWGQVRVAFLQGLLDLVIGLVLAMGTGAVLLFGIMHVRSRTITLGEFLLVMGYLTQLYRPMQMISKSITAMQGGLAGAERAFALLDEEHDVIDQVQGRPISRARGAVTFREVSFGYEPDNLVLEEVSFDIEPGSRVGIAGTTGAGKTTLLSLLTRFYDPLHGHILLDGIDLREYRLADLRKQFAIVLQEPVLFSTTVAENIAYARPGAHLDEVIRAAKSADAHEFITRLPDGYNTTVGERGSRLSGGERQRISLARAFLRDAPILLLDEPTSSVDVRTEARIMEAMSRLMSGRTSFIIAHRLSTLDVCDIKLQIEGGRLERYSPPIAQAKIDATTEAWAGPVEAMEDSSIAEAHAPSEGPPARRSA